MNSCFKTSMSDCSGLFITGFLFAGEPGQAFFDNSVSG